MSLSSFKSNILLLFIITHMSDDMIVYPMTTRDRAKDTPSKNRNNKFILDALNGLMDGRQFISTLVYMGSKRSR